MATILNAKSSQYEPATPTKGYAKQTLCYYHYSKGTFYLVRYVGLPTMAKIYGKDARENKEPIITVEIVFKIAAENFMASDRPEKAVEE